MSIRPLDLRDLPLLARYRNEAIPLDIGRALTRGQPLSAAGFLAYFNPGRHVYAALSNGDEHALLGGVIHTRGEMFARLLYLAPASRLEHPDLPLLIEHLSAEAGTWGAFHVIAEADEASPAFTALRQAGFSVYAWQRMWDVSEVTDPIPGSEWKRLQPVDLPAVQSLYHQIANDILEQRNKQDAEDIAEIRMVSQLKFAADLAPTPFAEYLEVDQDSYAIKKLPTRDDPMMGRVATIRERDYMFIDTLTEYYAGFYSKMDEPYDSWRAFSYEEQVALDQLRKERLWKTILGAAMVAGGVVHEGRGRGVLIAGGTMVVMDAQKTEESKMHLESLRELSASLDADVAPLLIDVEGDVMRLTGSVETQYETWRSLLRTIFATETGLPFDPNLEKPIAESGLSKP